ncbi:hypothetical protein [Candidatus Phycosocius spiralis]|uniref:Uncharacterized protein n=1 Tax=Candidatus Phycosocius spiralis TaxID=2815099 RepID=A0ABQ4PXU2_9PROT|nr:hypothetical protein [Candidatus Phycosocius spiralis]GIU67905.1 hypothetical protein PsB1_2059 [Candidatus Phycosocius spiralis]
MEQTPQSKSYFARTMGFMGFYILLNIAAMAGLLDGVTLPGRWVFAGLLGLMIGGQIWATLVMIRDSDEFIGSFLARQFILASGLSMAIYCVWGFGESYAEAPHLPSWMIYLLFWLSFAITSPFARRLNK